MLKTKHPLYMTWMMMRQRCGSPKATQYADYGGRGISVCDRWSDFWAFVADVGDRPEGTTLDRINNDGNYESGNVRWATRSEQGLNSRRTLMVTIEGIQYRANDLAKQAGFEKVSTIRHRAEMGLTLAEVLAPEKITHPFPAHGREKAYAKRRAQTHCKRGHELSGDNLVPNNQGRRICRECDKLKKAKWYARTHAHQ